MEEIMEGIIMQRLQRLTRALSALVFVCAIGAFTRDLPAGRCGGRKLAVGRFPCGGKLAKARLRWPA